MDASRKGDVDVIEALLAGGANVNQGKTDDGCSALILASFDGRVDAIKTLLVAGANVNQRMTALADGYTALMAASCLGHVDAIKILLDAGAKVNQRRTNGGQTALIEASERRQVDCNQSFDGSGRRNVGNCGVARVVQRGAKDAKKHFIYTQANHARALLHYPIQIMALQCRKSIAKATNAWSIFLVVQ